MPYYVVKAIDSAGRKVNKKFEADDEIHLISLLEFLDLTPIKITRRPELLGRISKTLYLKRIKRKELIDLFENLHLLAQSGVPLGVGLWDLAQDADNPAVRDMLQDVAYRIQIGTSISSAMARYQDILGPIAVNLIRIGEESGSLDRVFKDIADHYARIEEFVSKVKQALIYPAFALTTITGALIFWIVYVLPRISELFKGLDVDLPKVTLFVLGMAGFVQKYITFILISLVVFAILVAILRQKSERFRYLTDKLLLSIPIIRMIIENFNFAFFSEYMRLMISTGVSIYDTLRILEDSTNNRVFKRAIALIKDYVSTGGSISSGMRMTKVFPSLMVRMVAVGEEAGGLDEQLNYLARYYYNKLDYITQNISKIIEPVVIVIVGLFMVIIMVSLLLPIYDLITQIGRQV